MRLLPVLSPFAPGGGVRVSQGWSNRVLGCSLRGRSGVVAVFLAALALGVGCERPEEDQRLAHEFIVREADQGGAAPELRGEFELLLRGLHYKKLIELTPEFRRVYREPNKHFPKFRERAEPRPGRLPLNVLHFMQSSIWDVFHDTKYDVITTAYQLQRGELEVSALPVVQVWEDDEGKVWTLNHRRVAACRLAGNVGEVPVRWATREEVERNRYEYTTRTEGRSIIGILHEDLGMLIEAGGA